MTTSPRSVVITGASTGIGAACALRFDRLGWRVFAGIRREEDGVRLAAQASDRLRWLPLDVTDPASITSAAALVATQLGNEGLHGLVNNAGIVVGGPLEYLAAAELRHQFEVNVFGLVAVTQAFLPLLRLTRGRIVNIGSIAGRVTSPMVGPYCASKHAVEAISDALRLELAPWGIYTSVVEPGVVATPIWDKGSVQMDVTFGRMPAAARERYATLIGAFRSILRTAPKRAVSPEEVVRAVEHALLSSRPRHRYVIGTDARIRLALQTILPRRWMDAIVLRVLARTGASA
jgi:NAD(P)-dependent dehydrogenase (short-subunit alcohol dehydrogenase family)